jgi:melibiose permease
MNDISYWDLLPALTNNKKERDNLTSLVAVFASVGAFASGGLVPILTPGKMVLAYRVIAIVAALVFLGCQLLVFFGVHDNKYDKFIEPKEDQMSEVTDEKVTLKGMVKIIFSNKQLVVMAVVIFLYSLGSAILNAFGQNFFYFKFGYKGATTSMLDGGTMMLIFTVIYALGTIVSQAIYPKLANKFKRNVSKTSS